jgi:glucosamine--fructose-6-phosphate aminotransferase (isomerizing)
MEIHFEKSMHPISHMRREALQSASVVAELLQQDDATLNTLTAYLQRRAPPHIVTIARGSSDHAAAFFAYLCMLRMGRYVTSVPPSLLSLHQAPLQRSGTLALAFSQSGRSPDLVTATAYFSGPDSHSVALVNDAASPLAQQAQTVLPLHAGTEELHRPAGGGRPAAGRVAGRHHAADCTGATAHLAGGGCAARLG